MVRTTFSHGQQYVYLGLLHEFGIFLQKEQISAIMAESVFNCFVADTATQSEQRLTKYRMDDQEAPEATDHETVARVLRNISPTIVDSLRSSFGVGKDASFTDTVMNTITLIREDNEFRQIAQQLTTEERGIIGGAILGAAVFGSTLVFDERTEMNEILEHLNIGADEIDILKRAMRDILSPENQLDKEDRLRG